MLMFAMCGGDPGLVTRKTQTRTHTYAQVHKTHFLVRHAYLGEGATPGYPSSSKAFIFS